MKIALCTIGSRGDVQPFVLLAQGLKEAGHDVRLCSAALYSELAEKHEIKFVPFKGDYSLLLEDAELKKAIGSNPLTIGKKLRTKVYPILENALETFYEISQWADVVVYHPKCLLDGVAANFQEKLIKAYVVPAFTPTSAFQNPILEFLPLPSFANRLSYRFVKWLMLGSSAPVKAVRKKLGLRQKSMWLNTPELYGISKQILPEPKDYPSRSHFTGFWLPSMGGASKQKISAQLASFCTGDRPVLLLTFGSMPYKAKMDVNQLIDHILSSDRFKVILVRGWGLKDAPIIEDSNLVVVEHAPFEVLFPLVDAIVHHGGAGTTALALAAGKPQFILPVLHPFGDQLFWGKRIAKLGIGPQPIPLKKLRAKHIAPALELLRHPRYLEKARAYGRRLAAEDGKATCVQYIEQYSPAE